MNRCVKFPTHTLTALAAGTVLAIGAALSALPAHAQVEPVQTQNEAAAGGRNFPIGTLRGKLSVLAPPEVLLDGQPTRLAPGARVRNAQNMLMTPASLAGQSFVVNYQQAQGGLVGDVWILTTQEARAERAGVDRPFFNFWPFVANSGPRDDGKTPFDQLPVYGQGQ